MIAISNKNFKTCNLCSNGFDLYSYKPQVLIPCGHTFCLKCIKNFGTNICPAKRCNQIFRQHIPDHEIEDELKKLVGLDLENKIQNEKNDKENVSSLFDTCLM
jgi:hypothetical protein